MVGFGDADTPGRDMANRLLHDAALIAIFVAAAATFAGLSLVTAPYGRYARKGWGVTIHARWAWIVMELPALIVILLMYLQSRGDRLVPTILVSAWEIHYLYRTFIYTALLKGARKRFPMVLVAMAILFNVANGYVNGWSIAFRPPGVGVDWLSDPRFIVGATLFLLGFLIHVQSDTILRRLRRPGETGYRIPQGGLFRSVSSPNYLGEIVQWCGWAVASWSLAGLAFAVFTAANLAPRAVSHHRWYRETFPDYPGNRRALIPFVL